MPHAPRQGLRAPFSLIILSYIVISKSHRAIFFFHIIDTFSARLRLHMGDRRKAFRNLDGDGFTRHSHYFRQLTLPELS